ncbi:hypothetical protein SRABI05_00365 [Agrobacterium fabrum]|uniref:hypothetical protein n=1 Tax=Agrobacterium fabrum TaxID=1176649 RepID=UPI001D4CBE35|nr:hypothetical protein [Agrobacterium fabrum]CAH0143800.1 hypothetical protein SRABI05_00365 [Agrobacterium fabrum]CAH0163365.1 hypothetical protein SRABI46_01079 [Agrobacterium fabrum]
MTAARYLAEDAMKRVMILHNLIEDMYQNLEALKKLTRFPNDLRIGHDLVVYQSMEVQDIMRDLLSAIPDDPT